MPGDDRTRLNLHRKLEAVLGQEEADHLMAHLPSVTWNEVATKDDVASLGTALRIEMQSLRTELRSEMHTMGSELRNAIHTGDTDLRTEMRVGFADIRTEMQALRADLVDGTSRQIKWLVTFAAAWSSLLVTVVRLVP